MTWINFNEVKQQGDFLGLLNHFSITGKQTGDEVRIPCPFHDDHNPSCGVNIADNKFNCFSCGQHGNILDFATLMSDGDPQDNQDLRAGAKLVMDVCGISTPRSPKTRRRARQVNQEGCATKSNIKPVQAEFGGSETVSNKPLTFELSLDSEHDFFDHNGICGEQIETFGLGFCSKGSMAGRIAIPIHNESGELVAYVGRWADKKMPEDADKYKFPTGFKKSLVLYNLHRFLGLQTTHITSKHIVLVEGFWSVQRLHRLGIAAVAVMGTSVSSEQIALLQASTFMGSIGAVFTTSVLWTLIHTQYEAYYLSLIFVMGLLFGYIRQKTGSLFIPILLHMAANFVATFQMYLLQP